MLKGINAVNLNCILSILNTFPEISEEWLLKGTGSMLKADIRDAENHRISKLLDTITTLQEAINYKSDIIATLTEKINNLENQLKNK